MVAGSVRRETVTIIHTSHHALLHFGRENLQRVAYDLNLTKGASTGGDGRGTAARRWAPHVVQKAGSHAGAVVDPFESVRLDRLQQQHQQDGASYEDSNANRRVARRVADERVVQLLRRVHRERVNLPPASRSVAVIESLSSAPRTWWGFPRRIRTRIRSSRSQNGVGNRNGSSNGARAVWRSPTPMLDTWRPVTATWKV